VTKDITLVKVGGFIGGSSIMSNMIIFNDPAYIFLSSTGAFLAFVGMLHEIFKTKKDKIMRVGYLFTELFKALMIGAFFTPMMFMIFISNGNVIASFIFGFKIQGVFNSFWWLLSLIVAWYSPLLWGGLIKLIKRKWDNVFNRDN
jgi:hypothetical protein